MIWPPTATFEVRERGAVRPPFGGQVEMLAVPRGVAWQVAVVLVRLIVCKISALSMSTQILPETVSRQVLKLQGGD